MDPLPSPNAGALSQATQRLLRSLARLLMRHGMALPAFVELAKRAYVDAALADFAIPGRKPSLSRAALLTGLTRKEVQRLMEASGSLDGEALPENRAARVVAGWVRDAAFHDAKGEPAALPPDGEDASFAQLVRRYSGDVPPRAVLDELLRVGAAERAGDGTLRLVNRAYIPRASDTAKLEILGADASYLIAAVDHNLQGLQPSRFQRKVMYDNLPAEAAEAFRHLAAQEAQALIERLDAWLSRHDRDTTPAVTGSGRVRAGLGIFAIEEQITPPASAPASESTRVPERRGGRATSARKEP